MTTRHDARLEVPLDAGCAMASARPSELRAHAAETLGQRLSGSAPSKDAIDTAVTSDLARIFDALGGLPLVAPPPNPE